MIYIIIIIGIILDLFTKNLASIYLNNQIDLIGNLLFLKYTENTGIAFSISIPLVILKILTIILIFGIFYYYFKVEQKKKSKLIDVSFGLVLAGAIGNGIERIFNDKVIDFIGVKSFAIFNLADSMICVGAFLYIFCSLYYKK